MFLLTSRLAFVRLSLLLGKLLNHILQPQLVPAGNADESQRALIVRLGPHLKRPMTAIGTWRTLVPTMTMSAFDPKRTS